MARERTLEGRVAVVTGASRGIGLAIARKLGGLGAKLSLCARSADKLQNVAHELKGAGVEVIVVAADVRAATTFCRWWRKRNKRSEQLIFW